MAATSLSNAAPGQHGLRARHDPEHLRHPLGNFVQSSGTVPLPQYLAGLRRSSMASRRRLYYVSPDQVNLQIPYETQTGRAKVDLDNPIESRLQHPGVGVGSWHFHVGGWHS